MKNKLIFVFVIVMAIIGTVVAMFVLYAAPRTSKQQTTMIERAGCLRDAQSICLVIPAVTGVNLNNQTVQFPDTFSGMYNLVVMPFDREQQVLAESWLPFFQELSEAYEGTSYYNIAALPDLNSGVRVLVLGGLSLGVSDSDVRQRIAILFLEDQNAFLDALAIATTEAIQIFIVDASGIVLWRAEGGYDAVQASALRDALASLTD